MKTILVPTDFSKTSLAAADVAVSIAKRSNAQLILLHVIEVAEEGSFNVTGEITQASGDNKLFNLLLIKKAKEQLRKLSQQLAKEAVTVKSVLRMGSAFHGMQAIISEQKVDLVVMGTKGSSGYEEILVGSNTEKVVRRSSCPVLSVNKKPANGEFKSIVYATALMEDEGIFSRIVKTTQELLVCPVHIVRINTPGTFISDHLIKDKLSAFAKAQQFRNFTLNIFNDYSEEEGIIHFAESMNADMIAMVTHGRTGLGQLLRGSIAEGVVNHSRRPVLTYLVGTKLRKSK